MSTCTSEIIIGAKDRDHGGICFSHRLCIYENSRAVLVIEKRPGIDTPGAIVDRWVLHPDRMLADSMVMAAVYAVEDKAIIELVREMQKDSDTTGIFDLNEVPEEAMEILYTASKVAFKQRVISLEHNLFGRWKIAITNFRHSSLEREMSKMQDYNIDIEVCKSIYTCEYSEWSQKIERWGTLE